MFVTCENPEPAGGILLALSVSDGRVLWQKKYKLTPYRSHNDNSYATATPAVVAERVYVLWQTSNETIIAGLDHNGRELWQRTFPGINSRFGPGTSPMLFDDIVVFTHEQWEGGKGGAGIQLSAVRPGSEDNPGQVTLAYKHNGKTAPYVSTSLAKDGLLFTFHDQGDVSCLRIETGEVLWSERPGGRFYGSPVWVNDLLYCINRQGEVLVLKEAPAYELPDVNPLGEKSQATPAVAGDRMYLRTYSHLISIGGRMQ